MALMKFGGVGEDFGGGGNTAPWIKVVMVGG